MKHTLGTAAFSLRLRHPQVSVLGLTGGLGPVADIRFQGLGALRYDREIPQASKTPTPTDASGTGER